MRTRWLMGLAAAWVVAWGHPAGANGTDPVRVTAPLPIGVEDDWPPFAWVPKPGAPVQGFAVELVREVFREAGLPIELRAMPFARCMREARRGTVAACFNSLQTAENRDQHLWPSAPLFREPLAIFARSADGPAAPVGRADLVGRRVGYHQAYHYPEWFTGDVGMQRIPAGSDLALLQMLQRGRVDFVLFGAAAGAWRLRAERGLAAEAIRKVGEESSNDRFWLAFSRQHPGAADALARFDQAWLRVQGSGRYRLLQRQHLPGSEP